MPYRLLSRCYRLSFVCLCLWSTLAYLWCFLSTDALILPSQFCKTASVIHYGTTSYGTLANSVHGQTDIIAEYSSRYATSVSIRSYSLAQTIGRKSPRILETSVNCLQADSTYEESESVSDEINDALDMALGEVRDNFSSARCREFVTSLVDSLKHFESATYVPFLRCITVDGLVAPQYAFYFVKTSRWIDLK
jgi:hypothetical protein